MKRWIREGLEPNPLQSTLTTAGCSRSIPAVPCHPTDQLSPGAPPPSCVIPAQQHGLLSVKSSGVSSSSFLAQQLAFACELTIWSPSQNSIARRELSWNQDRTKIQRTIGRRRPRRRRGRHRRRRPPRAARRRAFHSSANSRLTRAHSSGVPVVRGDAVLSGGQPHVQRPRRSQPSSC